MTKSTYLKSKYFCVSSGDYWAQSRCKYRNLKTNNNILII